MYIYPALNTHNSRTHLHIYIKLFISATKIVGWSLTYEIKLHISKMQFSAPMVELSTLLLNKFVKIQPVKYLELELLESDSADVLVIISLFSGNFPENWLSFWEIRSVRVKDRFFSYNFFEGMSSHESYIWVNNHLQIWNHMDYKQYISSIHNVSYMVSTANIICS